MTALHQFLAVDAMLVVLAVHAWLADRRRQRRRNVDSVGIINWVTVFVLAILVLLFAVVLTLKEWLAN